MIPKNGAVIFQQNHRGTAAVLLIGVLRPTKSMFLRGSNIVPPNKAPVPTDRTMPSSEMLEQMS
jgi:hypothetical protein